MTSHQPHVEPLTGGALEAANAVYAAIDFQPSTAGRDVTFGILDNGAPIALGRLQRYDDGALEIGGFWVREDQRGTGLARALVERVIDAIPRGEDAWCIPFDYLVDFYLSFGMQRFHTAARAPGSIHDKIDWCTECQRTGKYRSRTELLWLPSAGTGHGSPG